MAPAADHAEQGYVGSFGLTGTVAIILGTLRMSQEKSTVLPAAKLRIKR